MLAGNLIYNLKGYSSHNKNETLNCWKLNLEHQSGNDCNSSFLDIYKSMQTRNWMF